jgi:uncharacterized protein with von Willebrand factor type A (vWA) domain
VNGTVRRRRQSWSAWELGEQTDATRTPVDAMLRLVSRMRMGGVPVSSEAAADALRALTGVEMLDRETVRSITRCVLVKQAAHKVVFARAFDETFLHPRAQTPHVLEPDGIDPPPRSPDDQGGSDRNDDRDDAEGPSGTNLESAEQLRERLSRALADRDRVEAGKRAAQAVDRWAGLGSGPGTTAHHTARVVRALDLDDILRRLLAEGRDEESPLVRRLRAAAAREQVDELRTLLTQLVARRLDPPPVEATPPLDDRLLLDATADELAELGATLRPLARRVAARLHRARRRSSGSLDMRGTIRRSMATGGVPADPVLHRLTRHRPELVVLCDVSGSMAGYARFALALLKALQAEFTRTRTWVFVDGIVEITEILDRSTGLLDVDSLLRHRGLVSGDGRSDYAAAFDAFTRTWRGASTCRSTVLVIGDGRSHDRAPATRELAELGHQARQVWWLNPEPRRDWDTGDSSIGLYAQYCTGVHEVSTLRQLENCVASIADRAEVPR